jgi:hypothetical protein
MIQKLKPYRSYLIILFAFAVVGMGFSFGAQRGGIGQLNGFIAPLVGPWSRWLEPNGDRLKYWEAGNWLFAGSLSLITVFSVAFSARPKKKILRVLTKFIAHVAVIFWCLCGIWKVVLELT